MVLAPFQHIRPSALMECGSAAEVAAALAFARERGEPIAVRSGGHCFAGRSSTTGVVVDVSPMNSVALADGLVTVGAGARLGDIYDALEPHGVTIAGGCGPTVGIAGLALGGGLGILGRRHGLTCDQMLAAEIVLADGETVTCDDGDLFWALRGAGGGQFGVVTSLTLRTVRAPAVTCVHRAYPFERAAELIDDWQRWSPDASPETAMSLVVRPDAVHVFGVGDPEGIELPFRAAKRWLNENGPPEQPGAEMQPIKSEFFREPLPTTTITELVEHFAAGDGPRELDFSPWAGAYNAVPTDATAFPHRNERFLLKQAGPQPWLQRSYEITHPHGTGGAYVNFPDPDLADPGRAYHGTNRERVERVKRRYDPDGVFPSL